MAYGRPTRPNVNPYDSTTQEELDNACRHQDEDLTCELCGGETEGENSKWMDHTKTLIREGVTLWGHYRIYFCDDECRERYFNVD